MNPERWLQLMSGLRIDGHLEMFERVVAAYSEQHRYYHTVAHIDACLCELDRFRSLATYPYEVEAALWFHDVVYAPRASDNELQSAQLASNFLNTAGVSSKVCSRIHDHIMATRHNAEPTDHDAALVVDVDLSILGQDPATYDQFEAQVREEYKWVPWFVFRRKRAEVLRSFLERMSIYATPQFRERYEAAARANLERTVERLTQ